MATEETDLKCDNRIKLVYIRNLPVSEGFNIKNVEDALDYIPRDNDIIICSYPKTGTTWMNYIVWKILNKNCNSLPNLHDMTFKHVPFMEFTGIKAVESLESHRVYKHHLPYDSLKINNKAKYIYTYRNPMDTVVSCYHFMKNAHKKLDKDFVEFDYFFEMFLSGNIEYGDFFDHVLQYYSHKDDQHLLLISYEDLHRDKKKQILKIAKFLDEKYFQEFIEDETLLQEIMRVTEFNYMKKNVSSVVEFEKDGQSIKTDTAMFRKGIIGDSENFLKPEQIKRLKIKMLEQVKDPELLIKWSL